MSDGLNLVTLFGNLGADPELRNSAKGPVLKMRLATPFSVLDREKNERQDRVEWHNLTVFGNRAEALKRYLRKGSKVMVKGHLQTHSYEKEGQKHYRTEVIVDDLCFGGLKENGSFTPAPSPAPTDLPF